MPFLTDLESRFGVTRGDITITLFLVATTIAGFIYTTFFDTRPVAMAQREMRYLVARHDSIMATQRAARLAGLERAAVRTDSGASSGVSSMAPSDSAAADSTIRTDSLPPWQPLTGEDAARDERAEKAEKPGGGSGKKESPARPVDLNTASKEELMRLPGVGEKTALAIIERRKHMPFRRIEDILEVKGIGEKKFEKMKPFLRIR